MAIGFSIVQRGTYTSRILRSAKGHEAQNHRHFHLGRWSQPGNVEASKIKHVFQVGVALYMFTRVLFLSSCHCPRMIPYLKWTATGTAQPQVDPSTAMTPLF